MLKEEDKIEEVKLCIDCGKLAEDGYKLKRHLIIKSVVVEVQIIIKKCNGEGYVCKKCLNKAIHKHFLEE